MVDTRGINATYKHEHGAQNLHLQGHLVYSQVIFKDAE
jgi:hypothetical protein